MQFIVMRAENTYISKPYKLATTHLSLEVLGQYHAIRPQITVNISPLMNKLHSARDISAES